MSYYNKLYHYVFIWNENYETHICAYVNKYSQVFVQNWYKNQENKLYKKNILKEFASLWIKIKSIIKSNKSLTGTDRVAEVAKKIKCSFYINVQGDEPFFNPNDLKMLIKEAEKKPNEVINGYTQIKDKKLSKSK